MPVLKGLSANDRSLEDQQALNKIQGNTISSTFDASNLTVLAPKVKATSNQSLQDIHDALAIMENSYQLALDQYKLEYHVGESSYNSKVNQNIKDIANKVSPYYKKYANTDYINLSDNDWTKLAALYQAYTDTYGTDKANQWLNQQLKNEVGHNQPWYELMYNGFLGMGASAAGSMVSLWGNIKGAYDYISGDYENIESLNGWNNFLNSVIDNETTRYGNEIVQYGALFDDSLNRAKELGLSNLDIVETEDLEKGLISSATPWQALQSGGFTLASMAVGAGEAKIAGWLFGSLKMGAVKAIPSLYKGLTSTQQLGKLKSVLTGIRLAENSVNKYVIPGLVGTQEGLMEGLLTKLDMIEEGKQMAYNALSLAVALEVNKRLQGLDMTQLSAFDINTLYQLVWDEFAPKYNETLQLAEHDATIAGINNFYVNSAINGVINSTLKAGLQAPKVQKALLESRLFGWAQPSSEFNITGTGNNISVTPKFGFGKKAWQMIKEPLGEFSEEYMQTLSDTTMKGGATNNIHDFIENKYNGDGHALVGDYLSDNLSAAWTAFTGSLVDQESIKSGIMGALSSVLGTPTLGTRATRIDGTQGAWYNPSSYFTRGINAKGEKESYSEAFFRAVPWRSGLTSSWREANREELANLKTAEALEAWLKDPDNKSKFDGLAGTFNWANSLSKAGKTNDEFSYRNSALGKTINDVFMLDKLEGTDYYDSFINQLVETANIESNSLEAAQLIEALKLNSNIDTEGLSDKEIIELAKKNANTILNTIDKVKLESEKIDKLLGQVDEDTKQSLIFGQLLMEDWQERSSLLKDDINQVSIENSREHSQLLTSAQQSIIAEYGSFQAAQTASLKAEEALGELQSDIKALSERKNLSDKEKEILKSKKARLNTIKKELKKLEVLKTLENTELATLNELEIMSLDPTTRATMFMKGNLKLYSTIHGDNEKRKTLTDEIFDLKQQVKALTNESGKPKKHKFKLVHKLNLEIADREKQLKNIVTETRNHYTEELQAVIDNLIARGNQLQAGFFDKVVDLGRMEASMQNYLALYNAILSDPESYVNYIQRAKLAASDALTGKKFESLNRITDYKAFATEMDKLLNTGTERSKEQIFRALDKNGNENYKRYNQSRELTSKLLNKLVNSDKFAQMEANDTDMFVHTLNYLNDLGVDLTDNNQVVSALSATDENGNKFELYVEALNENSPQELKTIFTSTGEALLNFNEIMLSVLSDEAETERNNREVTPDTNITDSLSQPVSNPDPKPNGLPGVFALAGTSPESGFTQEEQQGLKLDVEGLPPITGTELIIDLTETSLKQTETKKDTETINPIVARYGTLSNKEVANSAELALKVIDKSSNTYTEEAKQLARLIIEVLSDEAFDDNEDFTSALNVQANKLDTKGNEQAASLLRNAISKINAAKLIDKETQVPKNIFDKRKQEALTDRVSMMPNANPLSATMTTIDISYIRDTYPLSALVSYYDKYGIENYLLNTSLIDKDILFTTDSELNEAVKQSMGNKYLEDTSGVIIAIVKDSNGMLELEGKKYQPIGIMPSTNFLYSAGSAHMAPIRKLANFNETAIIKTNEGIPVKTKAFGKSGGVVAKSVDNNYLGPNLTILDIQNNDMTAAERNLVANMDKSEKRKSPIYQRMKQLFLKKLGVKEVNGLKQLVYNLDNLKGGSNSVFLFTAGVHETVSKDSNNTIDVEFRNGNIERIINFNSRTKRAAKEIDKFVSLLPATEELTFELNGDRLVATGDTIGLLNSLANNLEKNLSNFISIPVKQGWSYTIVPTSEVIGEERILELLLVNSDTSINPISLALIYNGVDSESVQYNVLKNLITDESGAVRMLNDKDSFIKWQTPYNDVLNMSGKAAENISDIYDDNIWTARATAFNYRIQGVAMDSPFKNDGTPRYPLTVISNSNNALTTTSITQPSVVANDLVTTPKGITIDSETGAILDGQEETSHEKEDTAKSKLNLIVEDSRAFKLSDDEKCYVNTKTGKRYARVTSMIAADEDGHRFSKYIDNPYNVNVSIGEVTPDYDSADANGPGALFVINLNSKPIGQVAINANYKGKGKWKAWGKDSDKYVSMSSVGDAVEIDEEFRGKGYGKAAYFEFAKQVANIGKILKSAPDNSRTLASTRVWESLVRDGYAQRVENHYEFINSKLENPWVTPSTNIGTGVDEFVRDFFLGKLDNLTKELLAEQYPNVTAEDLNTFKELLNSFKNKLAAQGITIVSRDIVANGTLEIADTEGKIHTIDVAGTIDLLGYDSNGNFYIYDMKTMHNASDANKQKNKAKWERQTSMYKKFIENTYGIKIKSLQIVPIGVDYPTPKGFGTGTTEYTVKNPEEATNYSNPSRTQLLADGKEFKGAKPTLNDLFNLDYVEPRIVWDKLTDAERDLAQSIEEEIQTGGEQVVTEGTPTAPVEAQVQEPIVPPTDSILGVPFEGGSLDNLFDDDFNMTSGISYSERLSPIPTELQWNNLPTNKKESLEAMGFDESSWSQLEDLEMQHKLDCID